MTKQYARVIGTIWKTSNKRFANDAADYLEGVTPGWRRDTRTLGDQAAEAMESATYERLQVHARAGTGRIVATCRNGHVNVFEIPRGGFDETLDSSGIESYLQKNAVAAYAARETMREGINRSGDSEELVWSSKSWKPELGTGAGTPQTAGKQRQQPATRPWDARRSQAVRRNPARRGAKNGPECGSPAATAQRTERTQAPQRRWKS